MKGIFVGNPPQLEFSHLVIVISNASVSPNAIRAREKDTIPAPEGVFSQLNFFTIQINDQVDAAYLRLALSLVS